MTVDADIVERLANRRAIVWDGKAWFVREVRVIEHDLSEDEMIYRCSTPISNDHATLAEVPEVADLIDSLIRERDEARARAIEECAKIAEDHYSRIGADGFSEHGSQCLINGKCPGAIAKSIRALLSNREG